MAVNWSTTQVLEQLVSGRQWSSGTITYSFPETAAGIFSQGEAAGFRPTNASQQALMLLAMATWDDLMPQGFAPGAIGSTNIEFGYTSTNIGYAHAYYPTNGSAWFNVGQDSLVNTGVGQYGYQTFIHEIGHALGLNHMGDYNGDGNWSPSSFQDSVVLSIMSYFGPRYAAPNYSAEVMQADWVAADGRTYSPQTPMVNDVLAIQAIYGTPTTTRPDNTVYGFNSNVTGVTARLFNFTQNPNPILTIFDSGGSDTLNLSGWSTQSRISLEPGSFSSANQMTNNIAIAYNTTIENAEGGSAGDVIIGNSAANVLNGNAGNDELNGMAGDDTLIGSFGDDTIDGGAGTDTAVFAGTFASYTITISGSTVTIASPTLGTDRVTGVERFQFADSTRSLTELSPNADTTAPTLASRIPADDAGGVAVAANLVLTFGEAVKAGRGTITIFNADGTVFRSIAADDAAQVRFAGNTVTVDPAINLVAGRGYYVNVAAGAITDLANNAYAGIGGTTAWNFTTGSTDTAAPQLLSLTPADDSSNVSAAATLVLLFNEPVVAGSGAFTIRSGGQVVRTIAASDTSQVTISGTTVTLDPSANLPEGAAISVTLDSGALRDAAGNAYAGITSQTGWNFNTASLLADDFPFNTNTNGVVTPNGTASAGSIEVGGDIDLFKVQLTAGVAYTFELTRTSSNGLVDPYLYLYNPALDIVGEDDDSGGASNSRLGYTAPTSGTYYLAAINYDTIGTGSYTLRARTQDAQPPQLQTRSPADDATQVSVGADLTLGFNETVVRGSGAIRLLDRNGAVLREIRADDVAAVRINGAAVTIDPGANLPAGTELSVNIDAGFFRDSAGNPFAGIAGGTAWNFTTAAVVTANDDYPLSVNTPGLVRVNAGLLSARIDSPNDGDLFRIELTAGVTYRIDLTAPQTSPVDPYLALYGSLPEVALIDYDDDGGPLPFDSQLYFTPTTSGLYYLAAYDYAEATGVYSIGAVSTPDDFLGSTATRGVLEVGSSGSSGAIDVPRDTDLFAVQLIGGLQYTFALESRGLEDPFLTLLDAQGSQLALDDDTGGNLDSQLTYSVATSGTYYVGAQDFDLGSGRYLLSAFVRSVVNGSGSNDTLNGTSAAETLVGRGGNDRLQGNAGDDILQGDSGIDFGVFTGRTRNFVIGPVEGGWFIRDDVGPQGRDLLYGVERALFDDGPWALDIEGNAGITAKVLGAVFGAASVENESYVGIGLSLLDGGMSYASLMQLAIEAALGARPSNGAVVNLLYRNLFGALPSTSDRLTFEGLIANGTFTQASLGIAAAESEWNLTNIDFVGIAETGLPYQFFG